MSASTLSALVIAGLAVLSSIGSVAMLSFRVGRLVGLVEGHIASSEADRNRIREDIGKLFYRDERHIEIFHRGDRDNA